MKKRKRKATIRKGCMQMEGMVNPNGAFHDIAGICDPSGTVFGLMSHPERSYYDRQLSDWTKEERMPKCGYGKLVFESMVEYLRKKS